MPERVSTLPTLGRCYTAAELAAALRFDPRTIRAMCARGDIRPAYQLGSEYRIPPHAQVRAGGANFRIYDLQQVAS